MNIILGRLLVLGFFCVFSITKICLAQFTYDPINDNYISSNYYVQVNNIKTSADLYSVAGEHQAYINNELLYIEHYYVRDPQLKQECLDNFKKNYIRDLSYLDGYFSRVINVGDATAYVFKSEKGSLSSDAPWNNLIIMADGFEAGNTRDIYQVATDKNFKKLLSPSTIDNGTSITIPPLAAGYDICFVDFTNGAADIRDNAKVMLKIIEYACSQAKGNKIIVGGFSMGGQVSRLAMLYGQKLNGGLPCANIGNVSKFISIDSPNNGAMIPINLQIMLDWFAHGSGRDWSDKAVGDQVNWNVDNVLNSPAAIQMLIKHYKYPNGTEKIKFYQFLKDMGNYPKNVRKYAIVDADWNDPYPDLYPAQSSYRAITINNHDVYLNTDEIPPGSFIDLFKIDKGGNVTDWQFLNWLTGSQIGAKTYQAVYNNGASTSDRFRPTFIPFISVIDIQRDIPDYLKTTSNSKFINCSNGFTPFDQVYWGSTRDEHITFSSELIDNVTKCLNDNSILNPVLYSPVITNLLLE